MSAPEADGEGRRTMNARASTGTRLDEQNSVARPSENMRASDAGNSCFPPDLPKNVGPMGPTGPATNKRLKTPKNAPEISGTHRGKRVGPTGPTLDFATINAAALRILPDLLARWLSDGRAHGHEWIARNPRRADHNAGSFKVNLRTGKWADFATGDRGGDPVSLAAYLFGLRQIEAAAKMADMLGIAWRDGAA